MIVFALMSCIAFMDVIVNLLLYKTIKTYFKIGWTIATFSLIIVAFYSWAWVMKTYEEPLSVIYIIVSELGIVGSLIFGWLCFKQKITKMQFVGMIFAMVSIALFQLEDESKVETENNTTIALQVSK